MTGPVRDELTKPDAYDQDEGFDVATEDIAIVCWEAVRALRQTMNNHTTPPWMHAGKADKLAVIEAVQEILDTPNQASRDELEARLRFAITVTLRP